MENLDPEEAQTIVDLALKLMVDAVRRYGGYIRSPRVTAYSRCSGPPSPMKTIRDAPFTLRSECKRISAVIPPSW